MLEFMDLLAESKEVEGNQGNLVSNGDKAKRYLS